MVLSDEAIHYLPKKEGDPLSPHATRPPSDTQFTRALPYPPIMATITDWVYLPADDSDDPMHYYANLTTGESQWDRPRVLELANCGSASTAGKTTCPVSVVAKWVEFMDEHHGRPYLYNTETGESVWVLPADEDEDDPQCEEEAPAVKVDEAARSEVEKAHAKTRGSPAEATQGDRGHRKIVRGLAPRTQQGVRRPAAHGG